MAEITAVTVRWLVLLFWKQRKPMDIAKLTMLCGVPDRRERISNDQTNEGKITDLHMSNAYGRPYKIAKGSNPIVGDVTLCKNSSGYSKMI